METAQPPQVPVPSAGGAAAAAMAPANIDWSLLAPDAQTGMVPAEAVAGRRRTDEVRLPSVKTDWSSQTNADGTSAVSIKRPLTPYWDARVGVDLRVAPADMTATSAVPLPEKLASEHIVSSGGSAYASATAAGFAGLWDKTMIEARLDPEADTGRVRTTVSKSVPIGDQYSLTIQNGYAVNQQIGLPGRTASHSVEGDRVARFGIKDTGTTLIAGQSLSATEDRWRSRVGAEQKLFDGVTVSAEVVEAATGGASGRLGAAFKRSW